MARFYSNENIAGRHWRRGRRTLSCRTPTFAVAEGRTLLLNNRRHFLRLHQHRGQDQPAFGGQAQRIHKAVAAASEMKNQLIRVNRPC